ncbi:hypothetical protein ACI7BZ_20110 [Xanthobacter sp. AM11]|uniref:hypothetical protein n=1 Tax=Xanthobacter sp. AM11 TaxID=3380643 RepID=UPI0039BF29B7
MTSSQIGTFQFWNTVIGFIASIISIFGFVTGLFNIEALPVPIQNPVIFSSISFVLIYYFCFSVSYIICSRHKSHWKYNKSGKFIKDQPIFYFSIITLTIFLPPCILWATMAYDLNHPLGSASQKEDETSFMMLTFLASFLMVTSIVVIDETHRSENRDRTKESKVGPANRVKTDVN